MRGANLVRQIDPRKWSPRSRFLGGAALAVLVLAGSITAFPQRPLSTASADAEVQTAQNGTSDVAQGTLPLPSPGTAPAPQAPPSEADTKARAAMLAAKANIDVAGAWTKATGSTTAQVYLKLVSAKDADKLIGAEAALAGKVEIQDDSKPGAAPAAEIPAGGTVDFGPQGRHFILVGLKGPLSEGDSFLLTLKFDKAGTQSTAVKVLAANATGLPPPTSTRTGDTTATVTNRN